MSSKLCIIFFQFSYVKAGFYRVYLVKVNNNTKTEWINLIIYIYHTELATELVR